MTKFGISTEFNAPANQVWKLNAGLDAAPSRHPAVEES